MAQSADWTLGEFSEVFTEQNIKFLVRQFHLSWFFFVFLQTFCNAEKNRQEYISCHGVLCFFSNSISLWWQCTKQSSGSNRDPVYHYFLLSLFVQSRETLWTGHQTLREWTHSPTVWIDNLKSTFPFVCREMRYVCRSNTRNCTCCSSKAPFKSMYILSTLTLNATFARFLCWAVCEL